jgi:hypothetical protein
VIVMVLAAVWNAVIGGYFGRSTAFVTVGIVAAVFFVYLALRALLGATRLEIVDGKLRVTAGILPPRRRFEHLVTDIGGFAVRGRSDDIDGFKVHALTRNGVELALPLDLDGVVVRAKASRRALTGIAPVEHAQFVADRLGELVEEAKRAGNQYRVGAVAPLEEENVAPAEEAARNRRG